MNARPPVWVISLARAADRRQFVTDALREVELDFEFIDAVDGRELSGTDLAQYSELRTLFHYGKPMWRGNLACALSHLKAWQRIVDEQVPEAIILEDDVRPLRDFVRLLDATDDLPADRDVVTFHSLFEWASPTPVGSPLLDGRYQVCTYTRTPMGAQACLVTRTAARRLIEVGMPVCLPADELLLRPRPAGLVVYGIEPSPVVHEHFTSEQLAVAGSLEGQRGPMTPLRVAATLTGRLARRAGLR